MTFLGKPNSIASAVKCKTVDLGNSRVKRNHWSPPMLAGAEKSSVWAVGMSLCLQLHVYRHRAVPAADASPGDEDVAWRR